MSEVSKKPTRYFTYGNKKNIIRLKDDMFLEVYNDKNDLVMQVVERTRYFHLKSFFPTVICNYIPESYILEVDTLGGFIFVDCGANFKLYSIDFYRKVITEMKQKFFNDPLTDHPALSKFVRFFERKLYIVDQKNVLKVYVLHHPDEILDFHYFELFHKTYNDEVVGLYPDKKYLSVFTKKNYKGKEKYLKNNTSLEECDNLSQISMFSKNYATLFEKCEKSDHVFFNRYNRDVMGIILKYTSCGFY